MCVWGCGAGGNYLRSGSRNMNRSLDEDRKPYASIGVKVVLHICVCMCACLCFILTLCFFFSHASMMEFRHGWTTLYYSSFL